MNVKFYHETETATPLVTPPVESLVKYPPTPSAQLYSSPILNRAATVTVVVPSLVTSTEAVAVSAGTSLSISARTFLDDSVKFKSGLIKISDIVHLKKLLGCGYNSVHLRDCRV